jgi:hypothetical protein
MDSLRDWTSSTEPIIRYYSGTAVYTRTFTLRPRRSHHYTLHFGTLHDMARVVVNGQEAGIVWCSPFSLDITPYLRSGHNELRIEVANSLYNRMIGDASLPEAERTTWATTPIVTAQTPLCPSGMADVEIRVW